MVVEVRLGNILVEGKRMGCGGQELVDGVEESSVVLVEYLEILEMVCIVLEDFDVQRYFGTEVQIGFLELVHIVQIVLKALHVPCFGRSWFQVGIRMVL